MGVSPGLTKGATGCHGTGGVAIHWRTQLVVMLLMLLWKEPSLVAAGTENKIDVRMADVTPGQGHGVVMGSIQILHNGRWGFICADGFDLSAANLTCHLLGYYNGLTYSLLKNEASFVWLDGIDCNGDERNLTDCLQFPAWGATGECPENKMAGVICGGKDLESGRVFLQQAGCETEGRLVVYNNGRLGVVCAHNFDDVDAAVACREQGYKTGWSHDIDAQEQELKHADWTDVNCHGNEKALTDCNHTQTRCEDIKGHLAGVTCSHSQERKSCDGSIITAKEGDMRMADGATEADGRLEVFYHGQWGVVCKTQSANISYTWICSQLGFTKGKPLKRVRHHGPDEIRLTYGQCQMQEAGCKPSVIKPVKPCPPIGIYCSGKRKVKPDCETHECQQAAICLEGKDGAYCVCPPDLPHCDTDLHTDGCLTTVCDHGGTCKETVSGAKCVCAPGYQGDYCHLVSGSYALLPTWVIVCIVAIIVLGMSLIITGSWCFWKSRRLAVPHMRLQQEEEQDYIDDYHDKDDNEEL